MVTIARTGRAAVVLMVVVVATLALAIPARAHPLGNFTSNTAVRAVVGPDGIALRYVLDLAEIPTTRYRQQVDVDGDGEVGDGELAVAAGERCASLLAALQVHVDGASVVIRPGAHELTFPEGQASLPTTRLVCDARADADTEQARITIVDDNLPDRIGWRELTAVGDRVRLVDTDVPAASPTAMLRAYPERAVSDPLRTTTADLRTRPGGAPAPVDALEGGSEGAAPVVTDDPGVLERVTLAYTDLVAERELTLGFGLFALVAAMLLGTLHALAPGHGKTVIAAYVVGQRGTARQALGIGTTVAITHTVGVLLLGLLLSASEAVVPERIYPWLGVLSGAIVVWIGAGLVRSALRRRAAARAAAHDHGHGHGHDHGHGHGHDHGHDHGGHHHRHAELGEVDLGWRNLVALGVAGGMAPSPSALLVLLGATALGRTWFGIALVVAYGVGLAGLLVIGGLLLVRVRGAAERLLAVSERPRLQRLTAALPLLTGFAVVAGGMVIAARGFVL